METADRSLFACKYIWNLTVAIYTNGSLVGLFFVVVKNSYTKFYENPTEIVVADTGSQTDGRVWVFTQGRLFLYVLKYD